MDDLESRPPGSVPVDFSLFVVPREPTASGGLSMRAVAAAGGSRGLRLLLGAGLSR